MIQEDPEIEKFSILLLRVDQAIFWILQVPLAVPCTGSLVDTQFSKKVEEIYFLVERAWGSLVGPYVQERDCTDYHELLLYPLF